MMGSNILGLMDAVQAEPCDSGLRLVYADALEDGGDNEGARRQRLIGEALSANERAQAPETPAVNFIRQLHRYRGQVGLRLATSVGEARPRAGRPAFYREVDIKRRRQTRRVGGGLASSWSVPLGGGKLIVEATMGERPGWSGLTIFAHPDDVLLLWEG